MTKIKAVVFDMDGLMFNTEDIYDEVGQLVLSRRGQDFTNELKMKMMGLPGKMAFQVLKDHCNLDDSIEELEHESNDAFSDILPEKIAVLPGLEELLRRLEELDIPKAIATSSMLKFAKVALEKFDLVPRFEFVLSAENVTNGKPHPEIYNTAASRLGIEPREMLVLEDSVIGSTAAVASGALTIVVPGDHSRDGNFAHVDHIVDSLDSPMLFAIIDPSIETIVDRTEKPFRVLVNGRNFLINNEGVEMKMGFYTTLFVQALDHDAAELAAVVLLRDRDSLREVVLNVEEDRPDLLIEETEQLESLDGIKNKDTGLAWYDAEEDLA